MNDNQNETSKLSFIQYFKTILWAFLGVRGSKAYDRDVKHLKLQHVIFVGLLMAFIFVISLIGLANFAVSALSSN